MRRGLGALPVASPAVPPLTAVAHELRTPLGGILGCADLLAATPLDVEQRAHLDALREAAAALMAFADDALELSRLRDPFAHAPVIPGPCDVRATLAGVARTLAPGAVRRGLELRVDVAAGVPAVVCVDGPALRRVLLNLGANAVRATRRGSVRFTAVLEADGVLACGVVDTGAGMSGARQEQLFLAWATGGVENGVGLGLVLAAELTSRMHGHLSVESTLGVGSTFTLRVPA